MLEIEEFEKKETKEFVFYKDIKGRKVRCPTCDF